MLGYVLGKLAVKPWKIITSAPRRRLFVALVGEFSYATECLLNSASGKKNEIAFGDRSQIVGSPKCT